MELESPPEDVTACEGLYVDDEVGFMKREMSEKFMEHVKTAVVLLLNTSTNNHWYDECRGCQLLHLGDYNHSCGDDIPDDYLEKNYDKVVNILWNTNFIRTIRNFLFQKKMLVSPAKIAGAVETLLAALAQPGAAMKAIDEYFKSMPVDDRYWAVYGDQRVISNTWHSI